jgi:hypothetical protein
LSSQHSGFSAGVKDEFAYLKDARQAANEILAGPVSGEARRDHEWDLWVLEGVLDHDLPIEALVEVRTEVSRAGLSSTRITFA